MKVSSVIARIRLDLADCDGDGWTRPLLVDVLNDVQSALFALRPELWTKPKIISATGTDLLDLTAICDVVISVEGVVDDDGKIIKKIINTDGSSAMTYGRLNKFGPSVVKGNPLSGLPSEASVIENTRQYVRLSPAISPGKTVKLRVWCSTMPPAIRATGDIDIPPSIHEDFLRMAEARLLQMEIDSPSSMAASDRLLAQAGQMTSAKRTIRKQEA